MNDNVSPRARRASRGSLASRAAGFTLVELLVVIGIIALLISILLPSLNTARQSANAVMCQSNMRQMGVASALWANGHDGSLPAATFDGNFDYNTSSVRVPDMGYDFTVLLASMLGDGGEVWSEQEASLNGARGIFRDADTVDAIVDATGNLSAEAGGEANFVHYTPHPRLMPNVENFNPPEYKNLMKPYKLSQIRNSSEIMLIEDGTQIAENGYNASAEGYALDGYRMYFDTFLLTPFAEDLNVDFNSPVEVGDNTDVLTFGDSNAARPRFRHRGNTIANFLFVDGHVEGLKYRGVNDSQLLRKNVLVPRVFN